MGLRCLIGHDYGPPETERDREDRGDEVVLTIREFKECRRCGDRQVISENTEVRAKESSTSVTEEPTADVDDAAGREAGEEYEEVSAAEDDGVILSEESPGESEAESEAEEWPDAGEPDAPDPESDEGELTADDREWPDADDREPGPETDEPREWPETEGEDEGYDAVAGDDASVEDVEFGGLTPERTDEETSAADEAEVTPAGIKSAAPGPQPIGPQRSDDPAGTVLVCPECEYVAGGEGPSLRPGDICPECRRGYLAERASK